MATQKKGILNFILEPEKLASFVSSQKLKRHQNNV